MEKTYIDNNSLLSKTEYIFDILNALDMRLELIQSKIIDLNKTYLQLEMNKSFRDIKGNSYLKFQIDLINNEKNYMKKIKRSLLDKFYNEIMEISESILMILASLENLEIEHEEEKTKLLKQVVFIRKPEKVDFANMAKILNITIKNLHIIGEFVDLFQKYIKKTQKKNLRYNNHCNNIVILLSNKRNHIILEYNKYCEELNELVGYFFSVVSAICAQVNNQYLLGFLIGDKEQKKSVSSDEEDDEEPLPPKIMLEETELDTMEEKIIQTKDI
jgi:hypothetical protein